MKLPALILPAFTALAFTLAVPLASADPLEDGFANPPRSAQPQVWWQWMNGNITRAGITADLEAMQQIGIGGATIVNLDCGIPHGPAGFLGAEWQDDFKYAVAEANRLGLNLCVENCAGWSSSGGPWVTATNAMQKITASEVSVTGPTNFNGFLALPPTTLNFYRDIAVLAFPAPAGKPARISDFDAKAGFDDREILSSVVSSNSAGCIPLNRIVNLTAKLGPHARLRWHVPPGKWIILRIGCTLTGAVNHPAPPEGTGLECDKLSKTALDNYWNGFMQKVLDDAGPLAGQGKTLNSSLIDSYEQGDQNWTPNFREEFRKRRGYDLLKYLPVFSGRVVENPAVTERFLWDIRRTIADLFADNYYGHFSELCREHGLFSAVEPYTGPFESLQSGASLGVVMGEFWAGSQGDPSVRTAASVAHIYGKTIVGTESFTAAPDHGRWQNDPYSLKALGDLMFSEGVNRYTFHRYAMQPWTNRWPGMTMGPWGIHFERTETWWNQGKPWIDYISRCQFLLQQGRPVQDAAYFDGQSAPVETRDGEPALPIGYDFDSVDAGVLLHGATVKNGRLTLASGANYAALILPPSDINMTPQMLDGIRKLVRDGATVIGPRPQHSPSLDDYPDCDRDVQKIADELWGDCNGRTVCEHRYGKGRIIWGKPLADVFAEQDLEPDFEFHGDNPAASLVYTHRCADGSDIYFVSNQRRQFESADCTFRVSGRTPELWHPDTGIIEPAPIWSEHAGRTTVPLDFDPAGSVFVVFRNVPAGAHFESADFHEAAQSKPPRQPDLQILSAVYGYFPPSTPAWVDLTGKVKARLANGTNVVPASNDFAGNDPAPNVPKQLRVKYTLNGRTNYVEVKEGDNLIVPPSATVIQARYGQLNSTNHTMDLTKKLESRVRRGRINVRVDNDLAGRDPASGIPKELRADYRLDGVVKHIVISENDMLALPDPGLGQPPQYSVSTAAAGSPVVRIWKDGTLKLRAADGNNLAANATGLLPPQEITGPWNLNFPPNWGAPPSVTLDKLISWTGHTNDGVRYFSGTATYEKDIDIPPDRLAAGRELWLDLGIVKNFADVVLNGRDYGVLWKPPFRVNITDAARPGLNKLVVKVTNLWPNRIIGDEQLPPDCEWVGPQLKAWPQWLLDGKPSPTGRFTFTTWHHYTKDSPLLDSGLLGPVILQTAEDIVLK